MIGPGKRPMRGRMRCVQTNPGGVCLHEYMEHGPWGGHCLALFCGCWSYEPAWTEDGPTGGRNLFLALMLVAVLILAVCRVAA